MPAGFRRHLEGKTLGNVCHSFVTQVRFFRDVNDRVNIFLKLTG